MAGGITSSCTSAHATTEPATRKIEIQSKLAKTTSNVTKSNQQGQAHIDAKLKPTAAIIGLLKAARMPAAAQAGSNWGLDLGQERRVKWGREKDETLISLQIPHQNIDGDARAAGGVAIRESQTSLPSQSSQTNILISKRTPYITQLLETNPYRLGAQVPNKQLTEQVGLGIQTKTNALGRVLTVGGTRGRDEPLGLENRPAVRVGADFSHAASDRCCRCRCRCSRRRRRALPLLLVSSATRIRTMHYS